MPNIDTMKDSKFLKKEDCGEGILVTMGEVKQENVAPDDKITQDSQTLDQIGSALPNSV